VSFIMAPRIAALSPRKPASSAMFLDDFRGQGHDRRDISYYDRINPNRITLK
jgi:hypothetical protein